MSSAPRTRIVRLLVRITISGFALAIFAMHIAGSPRFEVIDRIENYLYDVRIRLTMPGSVDDRIVIVDIDEASQAELGQWPWPPDSRRGIKHGTEGNYLDYVIAEQAFMAVQMLVIEVDDPDLEAALDALANSLNNDERYRPSEFRRLLTSLRNN